MNFSVVKTFLPFFFICQLSFIQSSSVPEYSFNYASKNNIDLSPKEVTIRFLKWYKMNLEKVNKFPILIKDSTDNYMVNTKACGNYLKILNSSKCLSPRYIAYWRSYLEDRATDLQNNPVKSDIPEGFDLDFVLITQEPELILDHISEARFTTYSQDKNLARIGISWPKKADMDYTIELSKNKSGWQIDFISAPNFD
ncbi:MAG: hypothetical protein ABI204_04690 [Ginsengibacter sp.]